MARPFVWFDGDTITQLTDRLIDAGPGARLEIHFSGNAESGVAGQDVTLEVVTPGMDAAARLKPLNESHWCPPDC
jgi:hypothetical protein